MKAESQSSIWLRIVFIALLLPICFVFPVALVLLAAIAWSIGGDLKRSRQPIETRLHQAVPEDWLRRACFDCESPAEVEFLRAMVKVFDLKPVNGVLRSERLTLEMQVSFSNYRFDFLANGRQVIEIDGATYHAGVEQVERDRIRDEKSISQGYRVLRIPARTVFEAPEEALTLVRMALVDTPTYTKPQPVPFALNTQIAAEHLRVASKAIKQGASNFGRGMQVFNATARFKSALSDERRGLDTLEQLAQTALQVSEISPRTKQLHEEVREKFHRKQGRANRDSDKPLSEIYSWPRICKPEPVADAAAQQQIDAVYAQAIAARDALLAGLKKRCDISPDFSRHFGQKLFEARYPMESALRMVPESHYCDLNALPPKSAQVSRKQEPPAGVFFPR